MNYYFILEDEKSFLKVLSSWLKHMNFKCERVVDIQQIKENNYVLQSGQGVTQLITKVLFQTIETIKQNPGKIDKLVVVLDAEEEDVTTREQEVYDKIKKQYDLEELDFTIKVFVCNHCFETWLLGCEGMYPQNVEENSFFYEYCKHYDIEANDPEYMPLPERCDKTIAKYHFSYLHEMFRYKKIRYSKSKPQHVATLEYFNGIQNRSENTQHIQSFKKFINFILSENLLMASKDI